MFKQLFKKDTKLHLKGYKKKNDKQKIIKTIKGSQSY